AGYTPRLERLERLHGCLRAGLERPVTLGGCRIVPCDQPAGVHWLVAREPGRAATAALPTAGGRLLWDGRFGVAVARGAALAVGPLGAVGWRSLVNQLEKAGTNSRSASVPAAARAGLPALRDAAGLVAVPPLGYFRDEGAAARLKGCDFAPANAL